jgi:hypothetical protein
LGQAVRADPTLIQRLEQQVANSTNPQSLANLLAIVRTAAPQVAVTADLAAFLADEPRFAPLVERLIYCSQAAPTPTS